MSHFGLSKRNSFLSLVTLSFTYAVLWFTCRFWECSVWAFSSFRVPHHPVKFQENPERRFREKIFDPWNQTGAKNAPFCRSNKLFLKTEFDLTFQKWFMRFPNKNSCKTDLKYLLPRLGDRENFSHQIALCSLKQAFLLFFYLNDEKHQIGILD